jgi:hypothetical protein
MNMIRSKKAGMSDTMTGLIGMVLLVFAGFWFINTFILDKGGKATDELTTCEVFSLGGKGICKAERGANCYPIGGCPKDAKYCCIIMDDGSTGISLPENYGGSTSYDFGVGWIGVGTPYDVTKTPKRALPGSPQAPGTTGKCYWADTVNYISLVCQAGIAVKFPIEINVPQRGRGAVYVAAVPRAVINDDPTTIYNSSGTKALLTSGEIKLTAIVEIQSNKAVTGSTVKIYPYAYCNTNECKRTDDKNRGILRRNPDDNTHITVTFVQTVP